MLSSGHLPRVSCNWLHLYLTATFCVEQQQIPDGDTVPAAHLTRTAARTMSPSGIFCCSAQNVAVRYKCNQLHRCTWQMAAVSMCTFQSQLRHLCTRIVIPFSATATLSDLPSAFFAMPDGRGRQQSSSPQLRFHALCSSSARVPTGACAV